MGSARDGRRRPGCLTMTGRARAWLVPDPYRLSRAPGPPAPRNGRPGSPSVALAPRAPYFGADWSAPMLGAPHSSAHEGLMTSDDAHASAGGSKTILVVEDEEIQRRSVVRLLVQLGYQVLEAA